MADKHEPVDFVDDAAVGGASRGGEARIEIVPAGFQLFVGTHVLQCVRVHVHVVKGKTIATAGNVDVHSFALRLLVAGNALLVRVCLAQGSLVDLRWVQMADLLLSSHKRWWKMIAVSPLR